jgi:DNA-binding SARP family transcriptional activator
MKRVYLFGIPQYEQDGIKIQISRRKSIALLAYLVVTGKPQSRDYLASLFYPEHDASGARSNLRRDLFELKLSIGEAILHIERELVGLTLSAELWVDVNEFRGQIEQARQHRHMQPGAEQAPVCVDCYQGLTQAASLYSTDFMAGFSLPGSREFEEWQFFQAQTLRQALAEALQLLIQWHSDRDEYAPATLYARRWLTLDPLHEPAHRRLMSLYAQSGQQAAALRQFQECVRSLRNELGAEPDQETNTLYEAIRSRAFTIPGLGGSHTHPPLSGKILSSQVRHNLPAPDEPFTGRDGELERITGCLRDQADCRLITLVGPGGIGKTRLAIEAAFRLAEDAACPFCEGIFFVPLAALSQADSLILAIADALKLPLLPDPEQRTQQLLGYIQSKRQLLLLDNFEHLVNDQSIQLLVDLLAQAPQVKMLVTS